jgi:hypothetical protein
MNCTLENNANVNRYGTHISLFSEGTMANKGAIGFILHRIDYWFVETRAVFLA